MPIAQVGKTQERRRKFGGDYELACEIGPNAAIVFDKIAFFLAENMRDGRHFVQGCYWFYATNNSLATKIGFLTPKQVRTALCTLQANDYIKVGHFSYGKVNRTTWYTISEKNMQKYYPEYGYKLPESSSALKDVSFAQKDECFAREGETINNDRLNGNHNDNHRGYIKRENNIKERNALMAQKDIPYRQPSSAPATDEFGLPLPF